MSFGLLASYSEFRGRVAAFKNLKKCEMSQTVVVGPGGCERADRALPEAHMTENPLHHIALPAFE